MAKKKSEAVVIQAESVSFTPSVEVKEKVKTLLKNRAVSIFEREPAPAFAEGNLNKLVEEITSLFK